MRVCAANLNAKGVNLDFTVADAQKMMIPWASRLEADVPLAVLPTRTHGSIVDPDRASRDNKESIPETPSEKQQLGDLILQALGCANFKEYQSIQKTWDDVTEAAAARHLNPPAGERADFFHQYMQVNACVLDDYSIPVNDYFLEFFADTTKKNDNANAYFHGKVIQDVRRTASSPTCEICTSIAPIWWRASTRCCRPGRTQRCICRSPLQHRERISTISSAAIRARINMCQCTWKGTRRSAGCNAIPRISCNS